LRRIQKGNGHWRHQEVTKTLGLLSITELLLKQASEHLLDTTRKKGTLKEKPGVRIQVPLEKDTFQKVFLFSAALHKGGAPEDLSKSKLC
jgi:hypothetical protein